MASSAKLYAFCYVLSLVSLVRCETSVTPERNSRFLQAAPNGPYVKLTSGHCLPDLQVSKEECLAAAQTVGASSGKTQLDGGRDSGLWGRPHGCTLHNWGNVEWWGHSNNAECGHWNYNCVCREEPTAAPTTAAPTTVAPTTMAPTTAAPTTAAQTTAAPPTTAAPTTAAQTTAAPTGPFQLSRAEIVTVLGLSAAVHEEVDIESQHFHGFQERVVVEDVHSSALFGEGVDHARVYTKGCTGDFCEHCAIAFTATTDQWDFMEDLNISLTPFCGLNQVHSGFAEEMRTYMQQSNWVDAVNFMSIDRCGTAYAVGTSLGGAIASLFAFCANRFGDSGDDKQHFQGSFNIIPVTFGAPAIAKEEVYNGEPGQCFRGARVGIQQARNLTLDNTSTITSLNIISDILQGVGTPDADLDNGIVQLQNISATNAAEFLALRNEIIELELPDAIIALTDLLMTIVGAGQASMATFLPIIFPLNDMTMLITNRTLFDLLPAIVDENVPVPSIGIKPDFAFEFDAVPALLSGFKFKHPKMPFHPIRHPEGVDPPVEEIVPCDVSDHRPEADFLQILWSTIASLALPALTHQGSGNFPNHHLCCYFRSLTGDDAGSCGVNPVTQEAYTCDPPSWR